MKQVVKWHGNYFLVDNKETQTYAVYRMGKSDELAIFAENGDVLEIDCEEISEAFAYAIEVFQKYILER